MRPESVSAVDIQLDPHSPVAIPMQVTQQIRTLVTTGALRPGDNLPSTRVLAQRLGIARGSVVAAYEQLAGEGLVITARGSGTRIDPELNIPTSPLPLPQHLAPEAPDLLDCAPGHPDTSKLIDPAWRAAWRAAATVALRPPEALGSLRLRTHIAEHIRMMRGIVVDPSDIVVTAGAREGLQLVLATLAHFFNSQVIGVESPGYPSLRRIPPYFGYRVHDVPTDDAGLDITHLPTHTGLDVLLATPNHQYPFGGALSAARRSALIEWAQEHGVWLIEDDFSSELRYTGMPLPTLCASARKQCILLGTFSSVLTPSVACGYLVIPPQLRGQFREIREIFGQPVSALTQEALAEYLARGALLRHTERSRRIYMRRRDMVLHAFAQTPSAQVMPIDGGLHAVVLCELPASVVVARCYAAGIRVIALEDYWGGSAQRNGIVFGFGNHDDTSLETIVCTIAQAISTPL
ncbi:MAG: PLP-dependent aminotransferase family protein [Corynebacterium sp.]|nr:PLP-dependent aminotransferase family protein [Corynebacterium sp.]